MADLSASLANSFSTLSARERRLVSIAGALAVFVVLFIVVFSFGSKADTIRNSTKRKAGQLEEVLTLAAGYNESRAAREAVERNLAGSNVRLISYLEDKAKASSIELPSISPKPDLAIEGTKIVESAVEVTLTDVKLNRLVEFLTSVEAGPGIVKVKYLRIEPRPAAENLTAWVTIATYHLKS